MGMFDKFLPPAGTGVAGPGINMNDPRVARAAQILKDQGVPITRAAIAEILALDAGGAPAPAAPAPAQGFGNVQGGPSSDIVKRLEAEAARKRMQGPPPEMMTGATGPGAVRARRGQMQ